MSLEDASMVLQFIWSIDYCLSLDSNCTFLIARFIAGRSIKPISSIIETSNIITKIIWAPEFHYLKIEMSSMFCPKQLIIYLTELKTQSKEKRIHVWCFTWIKDSVDGHKRNFRGFNSEAAKFFRVRRKNQLCIYEVDRLNNLVDQLLLLAMKIKSKA
jgi:hypothetical protein